MMTTPLTSIWLAVDAAPSKDVKTHYQRTARGTSNPCPWKGIFTDDPATIGRDLRRPLTPFVPAPDLFELSPHPKDGDTGDVDKCDSPPTGTLFDFKTPNLGGKAFGVSIF
jgi:hypothetical protein